MTAAGGNDNIKVSVLCAAYNHRQYIRDALEGFLSQETDFAFEVLINDDCSADGTADIIREYAQRYPDIIRPFYQKENLFSKKISIFDEIFYPNARGEYIAICEGDDFWCDPSKLALQAAYLDSNPDCSACVHNSRVLYCGDRPREEVLIPVSADRDIPFETIIKGMSFSFHTSSFLVRRELIVNPPDFQRIAEAHRFSDYAIALWAAMNGRVHFIEREMSVYRVASNSASWSSRVFGQYERLKEFVTGEIEMLEVLMPNLEGERRAAADRVLLERHYELLNLMGRVDEMVREPFREIYLSKGIKYRIKHSIKRLSPGLHRLYRRRQGYPE